MKIFSLLFLTVLILNLAACGNSGNSNNAETAGNTENNNQASPNPSDPPATSLVKVHFPPKISWTDEDHVVLRGRIDARKLDKLLVNDIEVENIDLTGKWQLRLPLLEGENQVMLTGLDRRGNKIISTDGPIINKRIAIYQATGLEFNSELNTLLVGDTERNSVIEIDIDTGERRYFKDPIPKSDTRRFYFKDWSLDSKNNRILYLGHEEIATFDLHSKEKEHLFDKEMISNLGYPWVGELDENNNMWFVARNDVVSLNLESGEQTIFHEQVGSGGASTSEPVRIYHSEGFALDLTGQRVFAAVFADHIVQVDLKTSKKSKLEAKSGLRFRWTSDIEYDAKENRLIVADRRHPFLIQLDLETLHAAYIGETNIRPDSVFYYPYEIKADFENDRVFVHDRNGDGIYLVDLTNGQRRRIGNISGVEHNRYSHPYSMTIDQQGRVFVGDPGLNHISQLDLDTGEYRILSDIYRENALLRMNIAPGIGIDPFKNKVVVSENDSVIDVDLNTGEQSVSESPVMNEFYGFDSQNRRVVNYYTRGLEGGVIIEIANIDKQKEDRLITLDVPSNPLDTGVHAIDEKNNILYSAVNNNEVMVFYKTDLSEDGQSEKLSFEVNFANFAGMNDESNFTSADYLLFNHEENDLLMISFGYDGDGELFLKIDLDDNSITALSEKPDIRRLWGADAVVIDERNNNAILADVRSHNLMAMDLVTGHSVYLSVK